MNLGQAIASGKAIGCVYNSGRRAGLVRFVIVMAWLQDAIVVYDPSARRFPWSLYRLGETRFLTYANAPEMLERAKRAWPAIRERFLKGKDARWEYGRPFPPNLASVELQQAIGRTL